GPTDRQRRRRAYLPGAGDSRPSCRRPAGLAASPAAAQAASLRPRVPLGETDVGRGLVPRRETTRRPMRMTPMNRDLWSLLRKLLQGVDLPPGELAPPASAVAGRSPQPANAGARLNVRDWVRGQAEIATGLWRLRRRMVDPRTGEPLDDLRKCFRDLESVWDALARLGVEIQEHTGSPYDPGQRLRVIEFQPVPGAPGETVLETIKPSVYFKGQLIQMGEIIVGMPAPGARPEPPRPPGNPASQGELPHGTDHG